MKKVMQWFGGKLGGVLTDAQMYQGILHEVLYVALVMLLGVLMCWIVRGLI